MNCVVKINRNEFDEMNKYLADGNDLTVHSLEQEATLLSLSANFDDQYKSVIEIFTGQESVMATAYLYNQEDECVEFIESDGGLDNEYTFEFNDSKYTLLLEVV